MEEKSVKSKVLRGAFWLFMEKGGLGIVEFIVAWILARFFLDPADYSTTGLITIFISLAGIFIKGGFNYAIVQKKEITEKDKSTIFWLSLSIAAVCYVLLFIFAPFIAKFYDKPILTAVLRVEAVVLIFDALSIVQTALLERALEFKKLFLKTVVTVFASAAVGILFACLGFGLWTIVAEAVTVSVVGCVMLWIFAGWTPKPIFSKDSLKQSSGFSLRLLVSNLINNLYSNALPFVMDKLYANDTLGYYNKSKTIPAKISDSVNSTVSSIVFPSLSKCQSDPKRVKEMTRRFIVTSCFLTFSLMAGLIAVAKPMVLFIYTSKWENSIIFMQFVCISYALSPINSANLQAIKALGRSDIYLLLEVIKNGIGIVLLGLTMFFTRNIETGLYVVLAMQALISVICVVINAFPNKKLMDYSVLEQIKDVLPSLLLAITMGVIVWSVTLLGLPNFVTLIIQVPLGVIIYVGLAKLFKMECFEYLLTLLKEWRAKKRGQN